MKVLLGLAGSISAILNDKIRSALIKEGHEVNTIFTNAARRIYFGHDGVLEFDENQYYDTKKSVYHIDLRRESDIFLIAPLSANTLGKISNGLCDNVLTNVARCWDYSKPMILAPAMNTYMWDNPITRRQIRLMKDMGAFVVNPVVKTLACGDTGVGALAPIEDIVEQVTNSRIETCNTFRSCLHK